MMPLAAVFPAPACSKVTGERFGVCMLCQVPDDHCLGGEHRGRGWQPAAVRADQCQPVRAGSDLECPGALHRAGECAVPHGELSSLLNDEWFGRRPEVVRAGGGTR